MPAPGHARSLLCCAIALTGATAPLPAQGATADSTRVEVVFLNVGQGDATVIRSPEGKVALIDAGPRSIAPQLDALGVDSIDLVIASHPHADHIGGMEEVLRTRPVRYYMDDGVGHTTGAYRRLMERVERSGVTYLQPTARTITLGSVTLTIRPPPLGVTNLNDQSVGVIVQFGSFRALLTGDSQQEELAYFLKFGIPRVTVLKAAHHGSDNGVNQAWLAATRPAVVVISCGAHNPFGHPDTRALRLYSSGATVYRTDQDGQVTIRASRDGKYQVIAEHPHEP